MKLAEVEATTSQEKLDKWNSETLKHLFRIYFGILKHNPTPSLLPSVMAGLSRHAHRIGIEYFADLLQSLRQMMQLRGAEELDVISSLHCINTVDRIYSINENLAAMDLKYFYNSLFRQLARLSSMDSSLIVWDDLQGPLSTCLTNLFHPKRIIPSLRVAAFVQRLADLALVFIKSEVLAGPAVFLIENIKTILTHHVKAQGVLDPEPFGQGTYLPICEDPDLCNPYSRTLLPLLSEIGSLDQRGGKKIRHLIDEILKLSPNHKQ